MKPLITSPRAYVRVLDLYTGDSVEVAQHTLITANVTRNLSNSGTAALIFANSKGEWRDTNEFVQVPWGTKTFLKTKRLDIWDIMYLTNWGVSENLTKDIIQTSMKSRVMPNVSHTSRTHDSELADLMWGIFSSPVFKDANIERMSRYNEFLTRLGDGGTSTIDSTELKNFFTANLYVMLRTRVDIDFTDCRGFIFPGFTGYVSSIDDVTQTGDLGLLELGCKDWAEVWKESLMINRASTVDIQNNQQVVASIAASREKVAELTTDGGMTPAAQFKFLIDTVNSANTVTGYVEQVLRQGNLDVTCKRDYKFPVLWAPTAYRERGGGADTPWDRSKGAGKFVYKDKYWADTVPYLGGPFQYDGVEPPTAGGIPHSNVFRMNRVAMYDMAFSAKFRPGTALAMQTVYGQTINTFQHQTTHPFERMTGVLASTLGEFFVTGSGDLVFKIPYLNHLPSTQSPWDLPVGVKPWQVWDSGNGDSQLPELFHGSEYILGPLGRLNSVYKYTDADKYTKVTVTHGLDKGGNVAGELQAAIQDGIQQAPTELMSFFGSREFSVTSAMTRLTTDSQKFYASSLLSMMNWKGNSMSVSYDRVLPWELGKTVYVPERDWLYRINSLTYSFTQGQGFTASLGADYGHPARLLLPIPWTTLYDGDAIGFNPFKVLPTNKGVSMSSWMTSYFKGQDEMQKVTRKPLVVPSGAEERYADSKMLEDLMGNIERGLLTQGHNALDAYFKISPPQEATQ